jgi:hypothetical protein
MRDNRPYGSEGGEGDTFPTPIGGGAFEARALRVEAALSNSFAFGGLLCWR